MKAANYMDPGQIEMRGDATRPAPAAGEVLVAVEACGICGSDLHMYRNDSYRDRLARKTPEGYEVPVHDLISQMCPVDEEWVTRVETAEDLVAELEM